MLVENNISLKRYNTFGLDYKADSLVHINTEEEAVSVFKMRTGSVEPLLILGSGSNVLFTEDYKGTILLPEIDGIKIESESGDEVIVSAGAGVKWDYLVEWCV